MSYPCICLIPYHIHGTIYRVASICFYIFQRCTAHRTMYMTCYKTYTWIRYDSVTEEYDMWFIFMVFFSPSNHITRQCLTLCQAIHFSSIFADHPAISFYINQRTWQRNRVWRSSLTTGSPLADICTFQGTLAYQCVRNCMFVISTFCSTVIYICTVYCNIQ
jgi:hypothetical protein